jgi:hypothetical protein
MKRMDRADTDLERMQLVEQAYQRSHRTYGYRRITYWLQREYPSAINHKAVLRLMQKLGIRSQARQRRVWRQVEVSPYYHRYANVLHRDLQPRAPMKSG